MSAAPVAESAPPLAPHSVPTSAPSAPSTASTSTLDKFYTRPPVAKACIDAVAKHYQWDRAFDLVVEPSAGNGSFLSQLPTTVPTVGLDIAPEPGSDGIVTCDFFDWKPPDSAGSEPGAGAGAGAEPGAGAGTRAPPRVLVIGNPPFGHVSSLAVRFFNHAARWATVIAFVVPRTFRRISVRNKLHLQFHKVLDTDVPLKPCAFTPVMMAKCCFQVWERRDTEPPREVVRLSTTHLHWTFLAFGPTDEKGQPTPPANADFAIRAYGGRCGEIRRADLDVLRPKSWHWIRTNGTVDADTLVHRFDALDYSLSKDTARQNSIGRGELVWLYDQAWKEADAT